MADPVKTALNVKKTIDREGRAVTFIKNSRVLLDSTKPWQAGTLKQTKVSTRAVFVDFDITERRKDSFGSSVKRVLANAVASTDLENFDEILDGATTWKIMDVKVIQPADVKIMYEFMVSK